MCPHGLPPGACPICSKMAGGGGLRMGERPQKAGEMSYHECVMIGNLMRARELAQKRHTQNLENQAEALKSFYANMEKLSNNLHNFIKQMSSNFMLKPLALVIQIVVLPSANLIKNLPILVLNFMDKLSAIKQRFVDIMDKLNAIFGEAKGFINKKISELISVMKTKFGDLFKIFKKNNTDDDDTKIDDDKKIFNLKTILHKIIRKKKDDDRDSKDK
jgi:hypothetical protein